MTKCNGCSNLTGYLIDKNIDYISHNLRGNREAIDFYKGLDIKKLPIITWQSNGETYLLQGWNESVKKKFEELYGIR